MKKQNEKFNEYKKVISNLIYNFRANNDCASSRQTRGKNGLFGDMDNAESISLLKSDKECNFTSYGISLNRECSYILINDNDIFYSAEVDYFGDLIFTKSKDIDKDTNITEKTFIRKLKETVNAITLELAGVKNDFNAINTLNK